MGQLAATASLPVALVMFGLTAPAAGPARRLTLVP
jgi:hypothetical protein